MSEKLLTVIVPAHNSSHYLATSLGTLSNSDLPRESWQLVVVDDASTDDTRAVAEQFADTVISIGDGPRGPAYARNRGAEAAETPFIAFVDADVAVHADALSRLCRAVQTDAQIVAAFGSYDDDPADQGLVSQYRNLLHHYVHQRNAGEAATFWAGCGVVKTQAFKAAGMFDEGEYLRPQIEDIELGRRLRAKGGRIVLDPRIQAKHLKPWRLLPMMRTDLVDRAIPWVRLLLSSPSAGNIPSPSLGTREIGGTLSIAIVVFFTALGFVWVQAFALAIAFLAISLWINRGLYAWFAKTRSPLFMGRAIPLHVAYQLLSVFAVPIGMTLYFADRVGQTIATDPTSGRSSVGAFLPLASGEVAARGVAFIATAYLARRLGVNGFGDIAFAAAVIAQFGIALAAGIGEIGSREVARNADAVGRIAVAGMTVRLMAAALAIGIVLALAFLLPLDRAMRDVTALSTLFLIPLALDTGWVYKGLGSTRKIGVSLLLSEIATLALLVIFVRSESNILRVPGIQALGDMAAALFLVVPLLKGRWRLPDRKSVILLSRTSGMNTVSRSLRTIMISFDLVLLGLMVNSFDVGLYSAAYRIVFFVMAIMFAAHVSFFPEMARLGTDPEKLSLVLSRSLGLSLAVVIPFAVGGILIASPLMALIFGDAYTEGALALRLLLLSLLVIGIHGTARNVFLAMQRIGTETAIMAAGVVVNIALNLSLIPHYGIRGAAFATVAGEGVILLLTIVALRRLGVRPRLHGAIAPIVGGIALGGALTGFGLARPVVQQVILGGGVYFIAFVAVHAIVGRIRAPLLAAAQA
ncbi:MAG: glycosyltransferase [Gemmatimonadales bacterium]